MYVAILKILSKSAYPKGWRALLGTNTLAYSVFDEEKQVLMTLTTASTLTATPSAGRATSSRITNAAPTGIPFQTRAQCYKAFCTCNLQMFELSWSVCF